MAVFVHLKLTKQLGHPRLGLFVGEPIAREFCGIKIFVEWAIVVSAGKQLLENSLQGGEAAIVDQDGFIAAEALALADEAGNVVNIRPLDRALGLDLVFEFSAQGCKLILLRLETW
jgi:hypothetical protein